MFAVLILSYGCLAQNNPGLFAMFDYQVLNKRFVSIGLGWQPSTPPAYTERHDGKYSFNGYTLNYVKYTGNADWGASTQYMIYEASHIGQGAFGLECNYKSIDNSDHISLKPIIGLTFDLASISYAYNFDFYRIKSERLRQHELLIGIRMRMTGRQ